MEAPIPFDPTLDIEAVDLGRMSYDAALSAQRAEQDALLVSRPSRRRMKVFLVEHDAVITISRRPEARAHLLATPEMLATLGIAVAETDRGGDITYHGPGQLVVYPILDLQRLGLRVHPYVRVLEDAAIATCAEFGVLARRDAGCTGAWVGGVEGGVGEAGGRKIAAIGVRISRWISLHGIAINVDPDLSHFDAIVPCGLQGRPVTSLARELGARAPSMDAVKSAFVRALTQAILQSHRVP
ncbi:MAG: lipoyl(octanoyl) transferase LipB [Planctomycetota bacterium]|nr:MAG: lipoyl(octanoyl) transferase LipB [Planctomycetota bacterium]RLS94289.1 MAG: lipoyl(octanoyl) transferase LipB [Planctomycetota bacterium]